MHIIYKIRNFNENRGSYQFGIKLLFQNFGTTIRTNFYGTPIILILKYFDKLYLNKFLIQMQILYIFYLKNTLIHGYLLCYI